MRKAVTFGTLATLPLFLCMAFAYAEAQVGVKAGDCNDASLPQGDTQISYCWDKQTGVLLEVKLSQGSAFITYKATNTNIWQASSPPLNLPTLSMPIEMLSVGISVAAAIAIVAAAVIYTKHKNS
jgi:hypothetical protein